MSTARNQIAAVLSFWRAGGREKWFEKDAAFDHAFRAGFQKVHMAAAARECDDWMESADGALALILMLDQFPRNAYRGTGHMYATDPLARHFARQAVAADLAAAIEPALRTFVYLPFSHAEDLPDQDLAVALNRKLDKEALDWAQHHRDIIARFGRFPHRNALLGRATTAEEAAFIAEGGFEG